MKFKLQAGMDLDLLTKDEVRAELKSWQAELVRGITFRTLSQRVDAAAAWTMDPIGPAAGFVWSLTRVAVAGNGLVLAADTFNLFFGGATNSPGAIATGLLRQKEWDPGVLVVAGPRTVVITGAATGTGTDVFASLSVIELPVQLAWQLL
jgi:hypothetical protein